MVLGQSYYVYILANKRRTVLYTGKSSDLTRRMIEHKRKLSPQSFTARYNVDRLVYFESFEFSDDASSREKQIKAGSRRKKIELIESVNPKWEDLSKDWDV